MDKELKEKIIAHHVEKKDAFPHLYDCEWIEKAADEGWMRCKEAIMQSMPKAADKAGVMDILAVIYYTSFEDALNTFLRECMEDLVASCELCMNEFQKVTAEMKDLSEQLEKI